MELSNSKIKKSSYIFRKWNFLALILRNFYIFSKESFSYIWSKESFCYISGNGNLEKKSSYFVKRKPRKNSLYFRIRNFLIFEETETRKTSYITFLARKIKNPLWKNFLYFGKSNFIVLKNLIKLPYEKLDA